jgi:hypothetical protein
VSVNWAELVLRRIGQFRFVDDQGAGGGVGRVDRAVARFELGNQPVARNWAVRPSGGS